ncbi:alpha/beta hydrolase [Fictibacillus terranigra]|uniref:Alpha/beta fold hydrolase n=1 Tax=Fictibacillus terranigra TaxID=3058424 RepID=A0ABT8E2N2_9BACL|nr:alpha/beta fold hydrolase [Fictibacillus sp. CENA-BCM004]MDN4072169.1 alpha/beta fold hydrolase [Fictibacillus sp. CENA-BCM004]
MIGCLCLHGFTGSPYEVEPVTDYLREHTDWLLSVPTYPGHGEQLQLRGIDHQLWIDEAERAFLQLRKKSDTVYILGFSMGGMIGGYLASKYGCDKLILLSASAYYMNPSQMVKDIKEMVKLGLKGNLKDHELYQRYRKKFMDTPLSATLEFRRLVNKLRPAFEKVQAPTLIVQGESDGLVPKKSAEYLYKTIPAQKKKLCYLKASKHMICHDCEQDQLIEEVFQFLMEQS